MSFIAELKRRNVIRAAGLYLVGAWLVVQVSSTVLPMFGAPGWLPRSIVILLLVGFIPAMIFSWIFELTPEGIKRDDEVPLAESIAPQTARKMDRMIIAVLALALAYFGFDKFVLTPQREATQIAQAVHTATQVSAASSAAFFTAPKMTSNAIAVLAFDDLSPAHDQADFSDGMAEEILNALTRIKSLKVIARSSSFQFKGRNVSPQQIGAQLGVAHILQGSVRKQGEALRITATLVQTSDGVQQWSNTYDGKLADVFDLQESCAHDIATQLNAVLGDNGKQRLVDKSTDNPDAYALFVEAQTLVNARMGDSLPRAMAMLEKATTLDPKFARAWSKLAVAYAVLGQYVGGDWQANWKASDQAARTALALDPDNAEAYAVLSYNLFSQRHYVDMVEPMRRALELGPEDLAANFWAANELSAMGRTTEAEARIDSALIDDPANVLLLFYKGMIRSNTGDVAAATALARRIGDRGPAFAAFLLESQDAKVGDFDAGAKHFASGEFGFGSKLSPADLEAIYRGAHLGEAQHRAALAIVDANSGDDWAPTFLLQLGEPERSFAAFERGKTGLADGYLNWLWRSDERSRRDRRSPAFQGFAKRIGLVDYWKKNRWPDLCSPTPEKGSDAFTCR
ncbi:MAG TPA: tetratricopeptide repeat protein [Xanthomonadaceae bacterium]|jgi:TolB-like protein/Tfp pilus assembly protein PilF|nr:tetratricopeptide repeat protein [Xanthomonadaceae bacterium]